VFTRLLLLLILLGALGHGPVAQAHDSRPAYLEINETAPGRYEVLWRTPINAGMRLPVVLKFPDDTRNITAPSLKEFTGLLLERRWIDAGNNGLAGKRIEFVGLQATITDVLVRVQALDGTRTTTLVNPSQPWVEIPSSQGIAAVAVAYLMHGFEHIMYGTDHLLFVLGLMLMVRDLWMLLKTITAFTCRGLRWRPQLHFRSCSSASRFCAPGGARRASRCVSPGSSPSRSGSCTGSDSRAGLRALGCRRGTFPSPCCFSISASRLANCPS
jgi:hypothetical protein